MSDTIIKVENLGKKYIIGHQSQQGGWKPNRGNYIALRDVVANGVKSVGKRLLKKERKPSYTTEEFWALKDINFEIKRGEVVGIIGRNGAGKSTLLKILSRITEPTTGHIELRGRVASLLEVGTGFHPELTGRENIYLNGSILGMSRLEIRKKFDEIVDFAEVEKFLDTPVKRYSSGMYVRLAFAVAAHLEPEILVVDEVLAVGDAAFQKKCLGKIGDVSTQEGRTVLFVSHNMGTLKSLCDSAMLLAQGQLITQDKTYKVIEQYLSATHENNDNNGEISWKNLQNAPGCEEIRLKSIRLLNANKQPSYYFSPDELISIEINYRIFQLIRGMRIIIQIINSEGIIVFSSTDHAIRPAEAKPGQYQTLCIIPENLLKSGLYYVKLHSGCPGVKILIKGQEFLEFCIENLGQHGSFFQEQWPGVITPKIEWHTLPQ